MRGILILLCLSTAGFGADPLPGRYVEKIQTMPDFCQGDERFGPLPQHGAELCAPTALSNTLVWLSQHGYPKLLVQHKGHSADQADLIRKLSRAEYMSTDDRIGTSPKQVITGIEQYMKTSGYGCHIEQKGWRSSVHRVGLIPDEEWLLRSCMGSSNVLINIGWYKRHEGHYLRDEGHWLTLAGFTVRDGHRILLIHDPAIGSGVEKKTEECVLIPLPAHHTMGLPKGDPIKTDGYFELRGIHLKKGADLAIMDGAIAFEPQPGNQ